MERKVITTIGFDADDTLWHNEVFFRLTTARFAELLADYVDPEVLQDQLLVVERRNLGRYGYGVKGFTLSMIETALEISKNQVSGPVIAELIATGREMLAHPIDLLPFAKQTLAELAVTHRILLITKGDLLDQERKLAQSGLGDFFHGVEIVSDKTSPVYGKIFARHGAEIGQSMMVGNSLKSDVLPMIAAGGWGVHVPHDLTWALEYASAPTDSARFFPLADLGGLSDLVGRLDKNHKI